MELLAFPDSRLRRSTERAAVAARVPWVTTGPPRGKLGAHPRGDLARQMG
jgi:hypothetical protein